MALDPLKLTDAIKESYKRYLTTAFRLRDTKLRDLFHQEVEKFLFVNGPLLEATPPFKTSCYLKDLIAEGVFCSEIEHFNIQKNPFYVHQEKAVRKIMKGRNVVIASGTSSGKTECFLLPIYNHLIKEYKEGKLGHGVRALLVYPMNALANDQLRRLRDIARSLEKQMPDVQITFGRYVGDTPESKKQAEEKFRVTNPGIEPVKSELLSREEMRKTPPHILITNYAMLEYLLLRPDDCVFFDGEYAGHWKFLVLDEAHIYNGAAGIEMAMLIRRLKDRVCDGKQGILQCIATSATLVKEERDFGKIAEFATNLFGEKFEWDISNEEYQDVIKDERIKIAITEKDTFDFPIQLYTKLDEVIMGNPEQSAIFEECYKIFKEGGVSEILLTQANETANGNSQKFLYEILSKDRRLLKLKKLLDKGSAKFEDCVRQVITNNPSIEDYKAMKSFVNANVWARSDKESLSLLPARYHLFVRAPEGIFVSFFPETKIFLERRKQREEGYPVFELASCRRCGQEYLIGDIFNEKLVHSRAEIDSIDIRKRYFLLWQPSVLLEEDEDEEVAIPEEIAERGKTWKLCVKCGAIWESNDKSKCQCSNSDKETVRVLIEITPKDSILNKCYLCGLRSINIVREFLFQQDAPAAVLATALFQNLEKKNQRERKILAFSDSRQDAAFFAPYMHYTYERILYRRLIMEALRQNKSIKDYRLEDLCRDMLGIAEKNSLLDLNKGEKQKKREIWGWILQDFCALGWERRNCLEGVGLLSFSLIPPKDWKPVKELLQPPWNLSEKEAREIYQALLNTLRMNRAMIFPNDAPSPQDEIFSPRNKEYKFRGEKSDSKKGIYSFISMQGRLNSRLEFLHKLYECLTGSKDNKGESIKVLGKIWDDLREHWINNGLCRFSDSKSGVLYQLDYRYWQIIQEDPDVPWFICDKCGLISQVSIHGVCPTFGCNGSLESLKTSSKYMDVENNHYRFLYSNISLTKMSVNEHTAQLKQDCASRVQQRFIDGDINVLSCSTTFELGVDLGELETIFLRNVPPEPSNYVQRSGRAGRRLDSIGFTLTFCQRRSHDLTYFKEPENLVEGRIKPPAVEIRNEKIVRRHLHSLVLSDFFRKHSYYFGIVDSFFHLEGNSKVVLSGPEKLKEYLSNKPQDLLRSLTRTIPKNLHETFDLENWGWVKDLLDFKGILEIANAQIHDEYSKLKEFYNTKAQELQKAIINPQEYKSKGSVLNADMKWAADRIETIKRKQLIDFLATHNIIPKYGFPVDVVELTPHHHIHAAKDIQLERDLRIAISEFAPGSEVVANGYIWKSAGLRAVKDRTWPIYWYTVCPNCKRFNMQEGTIDDKPPSFMCESCKKEISRAEIHKFIIPCFGFVTSREEEPQKPGESRPKREFTTRPYFFGYGESLNKEFQIEEFVIKCQYAPNGELAVICKGKKGLGFKICFNCGFAISDIVEGTHKTPIGGECSATLRSKLHLGHTFRTDILLVSFKKYKTDKSVNDEGFWFSLLYALLEGASQALGIRRQDLDGCLYAYEGKLALVLFDNVPGGAGHVKRIMEDQNLYEVLKATKDRVKNCTCGLETSCYGCLRNYQNQFCHELLKRGVVLDFLSNNLKV